MAGQTLHLKGNEFYAVQDIFNDLMELPKGWSADVTEGIKLRVSSDKAKDRVKVSGEILMIKFTLTIHKESACLITDHQCRSIETFVYDIVTLLKAAMHKPITDVPLLSEAEAQEWVKRCIAPSKIYKNLIMSLKGMTKSGVYNENGWTTGRYKMAAKRVQDNDSLLNVFLELYGGDKVVAFHMQESGREPFYLIVRDDVLYYDSKRIDYFNQVLADVERIASKIARGSFKDQGELGV